MKKQITTIFLLIICTLVATPYLSFAQDEEPEKKEEKKEEENGDKKEEKEKKKKSKSNIKPYEDIITEEAVTDSGLVIVHKVGTKHYFELPKDLLEKEILIVSRIAGYVKGLSFGGAGMKSRPQQVIRWQVKDENILLRSVSYNSVASEEKPIYESVRNNNFEPIIHSFPIAAYNQDTTGYVFEVDGFFTSDIPMIGALYSSQRKNFQIKGLDKKRSYINYIKSYPKNVEVRHVLTYRGGKLPQNRLTETMSVEMNQSIILLPEEPMQPRLYDARVGYFSISQTDYGLDEQKTAKRRYITRWRLEPKDMEAYKRGELVEPKKPIVYYVDPATPEKWRPYIKKGVEDWQVAFEKAGFKNAILAKDPPSPEEDPEWSPEDVRYSVIRYITTDIQNAQGPHVHDPRTGEILESDIMWYHNIMNLLRNWFFTQTAAVNPEAQSYRFKDEVMGELIRFVSAHEVGHTLGLPHNMGSSAAYPVDSLRSPSFTKKMGTAPSIMDYARFNHVAQPGDGDVYLYPKIGEYDFWSIIYGYKVIPEAQSAEDERLILNKWIKERAGDPIYRYGAQRFNPVDPSAQTEDLGDDPVKSSMYGIANLKRMMPNLIEWTSDEAKDYEDLEEMYGAIWGQLSKYYRHVGTTIGGMYEQRKTSDEEGIVHTPVPKELQRKAVDFLNEQLFETPEWLIEEEILYRFQPYGIVDKLRGMQVSSLNRLFQSGRLTRLEEAEEMLGAKAYTIMDLFNQTKKGIFSEVTSGESIDAHRRNLQRAFIAKMKDLMELKDTKSDNSDIKALARATLKDLEKDLKKGAKKQKEALSKYHLEDAHARVKEILDMD